MLKVWLLVQETKAGVRALLRLETAGGLGRQGNFQTANAHISSRTREPHGPGRAGMGQGRFLSRRRVQNSKGTWSPASALSRTLDATSFML
jgi:hypothetical protein